jgi:hypothetical protein
MDARSPAEKFLWEKLGPPLYYCAECLLAVKVTPVEGGEPVVERKCDHTGQIIAPRKAVCVGKGGMSLPVKAALRGAMIWPVWSHFLSTTGSPPSTGVTFTASKHSAQ